MTTAASAGIDPRRYLGLVLLGAAMGIPAALVAAVFLSTIHVIEGWLWQDLPTALGASSPPPYLVIGLPAVGGAVVALARRLLPGDGGHSPLEGIGAGVTPLRYAPGIVIAALGTLCFGAVLGPEAPLIAIGSCVGLAFGLSRRFGDGERAVLATAGSFAAISALFGGPMVGALLMVEGGLERGRALVPILIPGFVAAAIGYVIFLGLDGWPGLAEPGLAVPALPPYTSTSVLDLLLGVAVGVTTAVLIATIRRGAQRLSVEGGARVPVAVLLIGGGLAVGFLAQLAGWLGADPHAVLFSGQDGVPTLVGETSTSIVAILLVTKALGYGISMGAGFRGGPVFPAIFLGIAVAMFPVIWLGVSPTLAVAIGAAAGVVAVTRLLVTAVLFAALLTGSAGLDTVSAAVLASASAWITISALDRLAQAAEPTEAVDAPPDASGTSPDGSDRPVDGAQERPATA